MPTCLNDYHIDLSGAAVRLPAPLKRFLVMSKLSWLLNPKVLVAGGVCLLAILFVSSLPDLLILGVSAGLGAVLGYGTGRREQIAKKTNKETPGRSNTDPGNLE
jgi:hypothetical protein